MAVVGFSGNREPKDAKISELTPASRAVNITGKVISKNEVRNIPMGRDGSPHNVCEALIGDETGVVYLTLWDDNIEKVNEDATVLIKNGYVNLFRGNIRLNVGRYGTLEIAEQPFEGEINTENNLSEKTYEQRRRPYGGRRSYGGGGRGAYRPRRY